ncbi:hypothetical protein BDQ17DRAFT_1386947 [Cyathus striatus]|nr:hypothetical protein BDQ17DRAFT_1386947 [Cyathus striatus]
MLRPASLSRDLQSDHSAPLLIHSLHETRSSVLSLAASENYIFSGTQNHVISVRTQVLCHARQLTCNGLLALEYAKEKEWLFSSSGIWSTVSLEPLYVIDPYLETGAGDLFSIVWSPSLQTIFIGCQNTSLQCYPQTGRGSPDSDGSSVAPVPQAFLTIPPSNVIDPAHWGYVYCMVLLTGSNDAIQLATGSGTRPLRFLWDCTSNGLKFNHEFTCNHGAILAIVARGETLYAGCQDGYVKVLDLETKTLVRTIIIQEGVDILAMSLMGSDLYTCSANGWVKRWSSSFDCTASWNAHDGIVLSSIVTKRNGPQGGYCIVTGANDDHVKVWEINPPKVTMDEGNDGVTSLTMTYALSKFVSIPSVSCNASNREDCRQAAIWLKKCLGQLGAHTAMLPTGEGNNPIVLATFEGTHRSQPKPRILFYGHYDVIAAPPKGWTSHPFTLTGRNGYLYGRGVTDDKGPIMAVACAAAELLSRRALEVDLVFLIEGEEECGSTGFGETVRKHKDLIGDIDAILVSNSTWIAEDRPCITYGLRGVVHCAIEISSGLPDLHSGVEGGGTTEPMSDMIKILSTLTGGQRRVQIPAFYDHVRPQTEEEKELYKLLSEVTHTPASSLASRWREPSLTIHSLEVSGPKNATVIPGTVKAQVSIRIVPDQDLDTIVKSLCDHLKYSFKAFQSPNTLRVNVEHTADWWLGQLDGPWFQGLESAVQEEWGIEPLRIREGGSIPSIPYLEKEFGCHALHLPMGQSSDQAHLPDERISLVNLHKGKAVAERFLLKMANK